MNDNNNKIIEFFILIKTIYSNQIILNWNFRSVNVIVLRNFVFISTFRKRKVLFAPGQFYLSPFPFEIFGATQFSSEIRDFKMPKDKKRSKHESDSDSDSGPEDRGPAKSPVKKSAKPSGGADALNDGSGEPSWSLGNMKFAKVSF